jgi:hypothetical protein
MTDDIAAAAARGSEAASARADDGLAGLRDAHLALRRAISGGASGGGAASKEQQIRAFLVDARKTGACIADPKARRAAQGILDYWCAELANIPGTRSNEFASVLLEPFDATQIPRESERPAQSREDEQALIRLSAMARQWRDTDKPRGYLLTHDAVKEAARFADQDANLAEFVKASKRAIQGRRRNILIFLAGIALTIGAGFYWQFQYLPQTRDRLISELVYDVSAATEKTAASQARTLRWLSRYQPWLPPYDLTGAAKIVDVTLPRLNMSAPNFSRVNFSNVGFPDANLPAASFSGSEFSFDGTDGDRTDFKGADLRRAQFRNAKIRFTSLEGTVLYRVVFDRAIMCDVDFSGASLRSASFWAVTLNDKTRASLKTTAWWLAVGWPWPEIIQLVRPHENFTLGRSKDDEAQDDVLRQSPGFKEDYRVATEPLMHTPAGSLARAVALNNMAWTLAIWGIDLVGPKSSNPCAAEGVPANGLQAAEQAVCIARKWNGEGEQKGLYTGLLSNLRDTLAYIQMQRGEVAEALQTFQDISADDSTFLESSESSEFRYALALYKDGKDTAAALSKFKTAVTDRHYHPSHEIHTLRDYIFSVPDFPPVLRDSAASLWPTLLHQVDCPAPKAK